MHHGVDSLRYRIGLKAYRAVECIDVEEIIDAGCVELKTTYSFGIIAEYFRIIPLGAEASLPPPDARNDPKGCRRAGKDPAYH